MNCTHPVGRMAIVTLLALLTAPLAFGVGTGGTGLRVHAHGALSRMGGVIVKGITFDPSQAVVTINGQVRSADDLLPGMVANVDGNVVPGLQDGTAYSINVTRVVLGAVTDVSPSAMTQVGTGGTGLRIRVAGMTINPRADVVVAGCASLKDITVGTTLDVYGYSDGISGTVDATRIECVAPSGSVELHGVASAITPISMVVQGVTIDISAAQFVGFTAPIAAGDRVEVEGTASANGIVAATVTFEPDADSENGEDAEVEDAISAMIAPSVFVVDSFEIDATHAQFSNGTAADLAVGRVVHVEGKVVDGVLNAKSVEFDDADSEDGGGTGTELDDIDGAIAAFASAASFVVHGVTVDASAATFQNGTPADLANGKVVKVWGKRTGSAMKATKVRFGTGGDGASDDHDGASDDAHEQDDHEHGDASEHYSGHHESGDEHESDGPGSHDGGATAAASSEVQGRIATIASTGVFTVGTRRIDARSARFSGGSLAGVHVGTRVHATGAMQSGVLVATRVELDD